LVYAPGTKVGTVGVWFADVRHCTPEGGGATAVVEAYTSTLGKGSAQLAVGAVPGTQYVVRGS
jgi:hypothetical protein